MLQILGSASRADGALADRGETRSLPRDCSTVRVRRKLRPADVAVLAERIGDPLRWRELPKLSESHRSSVARVVLPSGPVVVKRYDEPRLFRLRTFGRYSRAEREARAMDLVASALPDNPVRVLAWAEDRRLGFVASSHVVVTEVAESFDLRAVRSLDPTDHERAIELVLRRLPAIVAALHDAGVYCGGSLRGKNVLLQRTREEVALIDQLPARAPRHLRARHRVRDLATLSLGLRRFLDDRQWRTFFERYLAAALDLAPQDRRLLRIEQIERVARRVAHRTPWSASRRRLKRSLRRSSFGAWLTGRDRERSEDR